MSTHEAPVVFQAVGECMVEIVRDGRDARLGYSGDTYNTAVYMHRVARLLGVDVDVRYLSGVGDDAESRRMREHWRAEGITDDSVVVAGAGLGLYLIDVDADGERSFSYWRSQSASAQLFPRSDWVERVTGSMVYLSGISLQLMTPASRRDLVARLRDLRASGTRVAFDSNYRPTGWASAEDARAAMSEVLGQTDIALVTFEDERELTGCADLEECADRLVGLGVGEIVIKAGADGAWIRTDRLEQVEAVAVDAVDTTAAGDSFNGGYLAARFAGLPPREAASVGNAVAGTVVGQRGAIVDLAEMPSLDYGLPGSSALPPAPRWPGAV